MIISTVENKDKNIVLKAINILFYLPMSLINFKGIHGYTRVYLRISSNFTG